MATSKEYLNYVLDNLKSIDGITHRPMMGEYLLYYHNILFGGIYDDRLLIKKVPSTEKYHLEEAIPYDGAKPMYYFEDVDNQDLLKEIIIDTCQALKPNKITKEEAENAYEEGCKEAKKLLKDPDRLEVLLQKLERKLKKIPIVGDTFYLVPAMISLVRSYLKKEYTEIPLGSVAGIVSALIYILSPIDLVPDAIPAAGYLDDAAILVICLKAGAKDDIEEYQKWRDKNNKNI